MTDDFPWETVSAILVSKTLQSARRKVAKLRASDPESLVTAWAAELVALRPADGRSIERAVDQAGYFLIGGGDRQIKGRLRAWRGIGTGRFVDYTDDCFAIVEKHWSTCAKEIDIEEKAKSARRQGPSPIVSVLLAGDAFHAADVAISAIKRSGFEGLPTWLNDRWLIERVWRRVKDDGQAARESAREVVSALEAAGRQELSLAWALLAGTPKNQMTWWSVWAGISTLHRQALLGELSAGEAEEVSAAIGVLQLCAEGVYVSEARSLWEILRPMVHGDEDLPEMPPRELPHPPRMPSQREPTVKVVPTAPKGREANSEYGKVVGAEYRLVVARDVARARAQLMSEYPHAQHAVDLLFRDVREGHPIRISPVLLCGPAGTGKSRLARRWSEVLGLYPQRFDAAGAADSQFSGVPRGWSSTVPCVPIRAILNARRANPVVVIDEIEKAASSHHNGNLWSSLTPFMEHETSARYHDPSLDAQADLSWVSYIATSNDDTLLPAPLRDRFRVINVPLPGLQHLPVLAANVVADIEKRDGSAGWNAPLARDELQVIGQAWKRAKFSVRSLQKIVGATLDARAAYAMRH